MLGRHDFTLFVGLTLVISQVGSWISHYSSAGELLKRLEEGCLVAVDVGAYGSNRDGVGRLVDELAEVLAGKIAFGIVALSDVGSSRRVTLYLDGKRPAWPRAEKGSGLVVFEQLRVDRSCLLKDVVGHKKLLAAEFVGPLEAVAVMDFVNDKCDTCWTEEGNLSRAGVARARLLGGLFGVAELNGAVSSGELARRCGNLSEFFYTGRCVAQEECRLFDNEQTCRAEEQRRVTVELPKCEELHSPPSPEEFFRRYLSKSKPVILKGAAQDWPAKLKWSNTFFRERFGDETVHVKLAPPKGIFEGVEHRSLWNISLEFGVPRVVLDSLVTSDLLVVRPDGVQLKLAEFLNIIESGTRHAELVSAYLEYTSLEEVFPGCGQLIMWSRQREVFGKNLRNFPLELERIPTSHADLTPEFARL